MTKILNNIPGSNIIAIYTYEGYFTPMFGILKEVNGKEAQETITGAETAKFLNDTIFNEPRLISEELEEAIVRSLDGSVKLVGGSYSYIPRLPQTSESKKVTFTVQQSPYFSKVGKRTFGNHLLKKITH